MYKNGGDGYIACNGEGFKSFRLNTDFSVLSNDTMSPKVEKRTAEGSKELSPTCFNFSKSRYSPIFGDEYSLFRSRSTSLSSSGSVRSTGTVCESDISSRQRSLRSTEPPSRGLSPLPNTRDVVINKKGVYWTGAFDGVFFGNFFSFLNSIFQSKCTCFNNIFCLR